MEFSSVAKIVCVANLSTIDPSEMEFPESKQTRYYIRSKKRETHDFMIKYIPDVEQRVFCKISGLLYDPFVVRYHTSDAFYLSCTSPFPLFHRLDDQLVVKDLKRQDNILSFRYAPHHVQWVSQAPWDAQRIVCALLPLQPDQNVDGLASSNVVYDSGLRFSWTVLMEVREKEEADW